MTSQLHDIPYKYEEEYQKFLDMSLVQAQNKASQQMQQQTAPTQQQWMNNFQAGAIPSVLSGTNYTTTTTGNTQEWQREYEVSRIVKRAENGYFFVISVDATDNVYYRVWKGGWFPYLVAKAFKRFGEDIDGNRTSWNFVTRRTHLPATLGSAYEKIDEAIKGDMEDRDHDSYIKEMLKTKPENLKMIGNLEKLAEGDVDAKDEAPSVSSNASSTWVSGRPTSIALSGQSGSSLSFTTPPANHGNLVGVATVEADKVVIDGVDIAAELADLKAELRLGVDAPEEAPAP